MKGWMMFILDDLEKIKKLDPLDMLGVEENFLMQLKQSKKIADTADLKDLESAGFAGLAILGMGGSGFTGDILKSIIYDKIKIPIVVVKGYVLPAFVSKDWLVVPVSYSGNTEETLSALSQAINRGCFLLSITSGGRLKDICADNDSACVMVPGGYQPRGAAGYLFFTTYLVLGRIGIIEMNGNEIHEALEILKSKKKIYNRNTATENNPAKRLAVELFEYLPVIFGTEGYLSAVAYRWKCEINENAKCPCFWGEFPELNHNETVGWQNLQTLSSNFVLVVFKDDESTDRIKVRIKTTVELLRDNFGKILEIPSEGKSRLARALGLMYLGDIASVYLAFLYNVDPTPVDRIAILKAELAKLGE